MSHTNQQTISHENIARVFAAWDQRKTEVPNPQGLKLSVDVGSWRIDHISDFPEWEQAAKDGHSSTFFNADLRIPDTILDMLLAQTITFAEFEIFLTELIRSWDTQDPPGEPDEVGRKMS